MLGANVVLGEDFTAEMTTMRRSIRRPPTSIVNHFVLLQRVRPGVSEALCKHVYTVDFRYQNPPTDKTNASCKARYTSTSYKGYVYSTSNVRILSKSQADETNALVDHKNTGKRKERSSG